MVPTFGNWNDLIRRLRQGIKGCKNLSFLFRWLTEPQKHLNLFLASQLPGKKNLDREFFENFFEFCRNLSSLKSKKLQKPTVFHHETFVRDLIGRRVDGKKMSN